MKQDILVEENKNLEKSNEINQLRQIIKSHEEKIRILSIKPLVLTEFSSIPEEFAGCSFIFSLDKSKFTQSKFSYFDDHEELKHNCILILLTFHNHELYHRQIKHLLSLNDYFNLV